MEEIKKVLSTSIPFGERVLWVKIYMEVEYRVFSGAQPDVAAVFGMNKHTFKKHVTALANRGAIIIKSKARRDKVGGGVAGAKYQLVPFDMWMPV